MDGRRFNKIKKSTATTVQLQYTVLVEKILYHQRLKGGVIAYIYYVLYNV